MAESQNSNSSGSEKDSLLSSEKNFSEAVLHCNSRPSEMDLASNDDEDCSEQSLSNEIQNAPAACSGKSDGQEVVKPSHDVQSNGEAKHPRTIKGIMMALKEGKARESGSPMRGSRTRAVVVSNQKNMEASPKVPKPISVPGIKSNTETPAATPSKTIIESSKRVQGSNSLKHQVFEIYFNP